MLLCDHSALASDLRWMTCNFKSQLQRQHWQRARSTHHAFRHGKEVSIDTTGHVSKPETYQTVTCANIITGAAVRHTGMTVAPPHLYVGCCRLHL